jgi:segregation and condensation protein A
MDEQLMYKLEVFEGPLDLLLNLISKNKMNIEDIQIAIICDQYMEYIENAEKMNIDLSADFLVMASQLMLIKSRILLPRAQEDEEDPAEELARMLLEYKHAKEASQKLGDLFSQYNGRLEKDTDEIAPDRTYVAEHDVYLLQAALLRVMNTIEVTDEAAEERIRPLISTKTVSVGERVYSILRIFLTEGNKLNVLKCFKDVYTKHEAVATFMAILELLRAGRVTLEENTEDYEVEGVIVVEKGVYLNLYTGKIRNQAEENNG